VDPLPPELLLEAYPTTIALLGRTLRRVVLDVVPDAVERVRPHWRLIGFDVRVAAPGGRSRDVYIAWISPERRHIHLGFQHGTLLEDPHGVLGGRGVTKRVRWLTYEPGESVDEDVAREFLEQAVAVARRDPRERQAGLALASLHSG
jgi:hypothetical protein